MIQKCDFLFSSPFSFSFTANSNPSFLAASVYIQNNLVGIHRRWGYMISFSLVYDGVFPIFFFYVRRNQDPFHFQTLMMTKMKMKIHHDLTDGCTPLQPLPADGKYSRSWFFLSIFSLSTTLSSHLTLCLVDLAS